MAVGTGNRKDAAYWRRYRRTNARYLAKKADPEWQARRAAYRTLWKAKNPEKVEAQRRRERERLRICKDSAEHKAKMLARALRERKLKAMDAGYAEFCRAKQRIYNRRHNDKARKVPYKPKLSMRFPEWMPFGVNPLDLKSVFLRENMDADAIASCDNYAMLLAVERRRKRAF